MKKVLFIDRDGTIIAEPADQQVDSFEKMVFKPGVISALAKITSETDYELVMVTNQDGLGSSSFPENDFWPVQNKMVEILKGEGIYFKEIFIDYSLPEEKAPTRKPGTAMLTKYLSDGIDLNSSFVIGDRQTDIELARNIGCRSIYFSNDSNSDADLCTNNWADIYRNLKRRPRESKVKRETSETSIIVELNLDGTGKSTIDTGVGFFDHMLEQIARHGNIDLLINVRGDIEIDEHHIIEDVAITVGSAINEALGSKRGINRYGFVLPMDDCLVTTAIDLSGRSWLVWDAIFTREKIGEMPTEMFYHFFKSLSDNAKCNINIKAEGINEHHKIEAIFKSFGKVLKMAVQKTDNTEMPSTKGSI